MKSGKKQLKVKNKEIKTKKNPEENEYETTSKNYFRLLKEMEEQNSNQKLSEELQQKDKKKEKSKPKQKNLTELIYAKNSKKLGNYYNKNQNDLLLYGSSKYDVLSMDKLLKEMGYYKSKVINKINENKNLTKSNDSEIDNILSSYENCNNKVILTPLAENEKERNEMEEIEKKKL